MDPITMIKAARTTAQNGMSAILIAAREGNRDLTAEETAQLDAFRAEDDRLAAQLRGEEDLQTRRAATAQPVQMLSNPGALAPAQAAVPLEPGIQFARITQALIQGNMDRRAAANWAEQTWGTESGQIVANLEQSTSTKGGFLVDTVYSRDFIGLLRPRVVVRAMGARIVPMPEGNLSLRKKTGGTTAGYIGERTNIPATGLTVGMNNLSAKTLAALVPISNRLLRRSSLEVDAMVRDDLTESVGIKEDQQFLRGAGSDLSPTGLLYLIAAGNKINATALAGLSLAEKIQAVRGDLSRLRLKVINANIPMTNCGYVASPTTIEFLANLTDGNGNKAFPEVERGLIGSYPYKTTTSVPANLGAGGNESEIYFADFAQVMIADTYNLTIATSTEASYDDGDGMKSAFQTDETLIRIIEEHDIGMRYDTAGAVLQAVAWNQ
jgi:HK97 family phage major capsid protein